jgi:predicted dehydrogenase
MIQLGVIGMGNRAQGLIGLLQKQADAVLAAVADPEPDRVRSTCAQRGLDCSQARFFRSVDELLEGAGELNGLLVGTRCNLHAEIAAKCAAAELPILLEKPIAISDAQIAHVAAAYHGRENRVVVSFPLRFSPLLGKIVEVIRAGRIGAINQVQAFNYVPYGGIYFGQWYRSFEITGGLWLQKATHDFDAINQIVASTPLEVAAMGSRRIYGGNRPGDLRCSQCDDAESCPESPAAHTARGDDGGMGKGDHACAFSETIRHHDAGSALIRYENGVHAAYSQNLVSRRAAAGRGARITGYLATLAFDWYQQAYTILDHQTGKVERVEVPVPQGHFGGDTFLVKHFVDVCKGEPSRASLREGLISAAMCTAAQRSEELGTFQRISIDRPAAAHIERKAGDKA